MGRGIYLWMMAGVLELIYRLGVGYSEVKDARCMIAGLTSKHRTRRFCVQVVFK